MILSLPELLGGTSMTLKEARAGGLKEKVAYIIETRNKGVALTDFLPGNLIEPRNVHSQLRRLFGADPTNKDLLLAFVANTPELLTIEVQVLNSPFSGTIFSGFFFRAI